MGNASGGLNRRAGADRGAAEHPGGEDQADAARRTRLGSGRIVASGIEAPILVRWTRCGVGRKAVQSDGATEPS